MPVTTPHLRYPFRIGKNGAEVVEQNSFDEVAQCVQIVLSTPIGSRPEVPTYGIDDPVFAMDSDTRQSAMMQAVDKWEPRAEAVISVTPDNVDQFLHHIRAEILDRPDNDITSALPYYEDENLDSGEDEFFGEGGFGMGGWGE